MTDNPIDSVERLATGVSRGFGIGPIVTVVRGSSERMFCSLEQLYDALGFLIGDVPAPDDIDAYIDRCRDHVADQIPELRAVELPAEGAPDAEIVGWLVGLAEQHHAPIELTAIPGAPR